MISERPLTSAFCLIGRHAEAVSVRVPPGGRMKECTCSYEDQDDRLAWLLQGRDTPGKLCGTCGGSRKYVQDCGFCGRGMLRYGPGGWTNRNRCAGCHKYTVPWGDDDPALWCPCQPLPRFKPRYVMTRVLRKIRNARLRGVYLGRL